MKIKKLDLDGANEIGDDFDIAGRNEAEKVISEADPVVKEEPRDSAPSERVESFSLLPPSPKLPFVAPGTDKDNADDVILPRLIEATKPAAPGRILIKDLKNSLVYSEVVKEVENKAREKAARMEDGELSDSSGNNRTPTLSPSPSRGERLGTPSLSPESTRSGSPSLRDKVPRDDLRMILKEKEKKRLVEIRKTKHRNGKDRREEKDKRRRSNSRSKSKTHSRSRRSRSNGKEKSREKSRERAREREKSRDRWERERSRERRKISRDADNDRYRSRSRDRSRDRRNNRGRSRSRERKLVRIYLKIRPLSYNIIV